MFRKPAAAVALAFLTLSPAATPPVWAVVMIEIMPAPASCGEWIELLNELQEPVNLAGWILTDASGHIGQLPSVSISPGGFILAAQDSQTADLLSRATPAACLILTPWPSLNDDGDTLRLVSPLSEIADQMSYDSEASRVAGRSWERINAYRVGLDVCNWGPCADPAQHTAGKPNSLRPIPPGLKTSMVIDPNPFNPFGSGPDRETHISVRLPTEVARLTVTIFDANGRRVRRIHSNVPAGTSSPVLNWDGREDRGQLAPSGRYIVVAEALDARNGKTHTVRGTVVVADYLR
jgi:hypothetical protein